MQYKTTRSNASLQKKDRKQQIKPPRCNRGTTVCMAVRWNAKKRKLGKREQVSSNVSGRDNDPLRKKCDDRRYEQAYTQDEEPSWGRCQQHLPLLLFCARLMSSSQSCWCPATLGVVGKPSQLRLLSPVPKRKLPLPVPG